VRALRDAGRSVWLLTGDRASVAHEIEHDGGIDAVRAEASPQDKVQFVRDLQQEHGAIVAMIGDGVNDAAVLAQAEVSIAMGTGADIAQGSADIVLAQCGLGRLWEVLAIARKAGRIVVQNLAWASAYNLIAVPAAVLGYADPLVAAVGMATSSLIVILNAMRAAHPALWQRSASTKLSLNSAPTAAAPSMSSV